MYREDCNTVLNQLEFYWDIVPNFGPSMDRDAVGVITKILEY